MAKALSVKMNETVFEAAETAAKKMGLARNAYINKAVSFFNRLHQRRLLKRELAKESRLVAGESKTVLQEFERLADRNDLP